MSESLEKLLEEEKQHEKNVRVLELRIEETWAFHKVELDDLYLRLFQSRRQLADVIKKIKEQSS